MRKPQTLFEDMRQNMSMQKMSVEEVVKTCDKCMLKREFHSLVDKSKGKASSQEAINDAIRKSYYLIAHIVHPDKAIPLLTSRLTLAKEDEKKFRECTNVPLLVEAKKKTKGIEASLKMARAGKCTSLMQHLQDIKEEVYNENNRKKKMLAACDPYHQVFKTWTFTQRDKTQPKESNLSEKVSNFDENCRRSRRKRKISEIGRTHEDYVKMERQMEEEDEIGQANLFHYKWTDKDDAYIRNFKTMTKAEISKAALHLRVSEEAVRQRWVALKHQFTWNHKSDMELIRIVNKVTSTREGIETAGKMLGCTSLEAGIRLKTLMNDRKKK